MGFLLGGGLPAQADLSARFAQLFKLESYAALCVLTDVKPQRRAQFDIAIERHLTAGVDVRTPFDQEQRLASEFVKMSGVHMIP